jgi:hypothetical protein
MNTRFLLPNYFKKLGAGMMPGGFVLWCLTQQDLFDKLLVGAHQTITWAKVAVLVISWFSFLFGMYFVAFSKEKTEDEYINTMRLHSFQVAALAQLLFYIFSFIYMAVFNREPKNFEAFLLGSVFLFWLVYIAYFHLTLIRNKRRASAE